MSTFPPSLLSRHPVGEPHSNFNVHQAMQNLYGTMQSTTRTIATNYSYLIALAVTVVAVAAITITAFALSTVTIVNDNGYYYPATRQLAAAVINDDAPLLIDPPDVLLACSTGRTNLCSYFSYVNHSLILFAAFINNGTLENDTLLELPYSNPAPFMYNVTNAKVALDNIVGQELVLGTQIVTLQADVGTLGADVGSVFYVERPAVGGVDALGCGGTILRPCATPAYAVSQMPAAPSINSSLVLQLGAGAFSASTLSLPCNVELRGADAATLLTVTTLNMAASGCTVQIESLQMQVTGSATLAGVTTATLRNVTFAGAPIASLNVTGSPSLLGTLVMDNVDVGGLTQLSISDLIVSAHTLSHTTVLNIVYSTLGGTADLRDIDVGSSFTVSTLNSGVTTTVLGHGWSNARTGTWTLATASGSTTIFRGDAGSLGLVNVNSTLFGPIATGGGTLSIERESGAVGQAYAASAPTTWTTGVPVQTNDALDRLSARTYTLENVAGQDITIFDGITPFSAAVCSPLFPPLLDLPGSTKHVSGTDFFQMSGTGFFFLNYTGATAAVFRVTLIFHALISYTPGDNLGAGFCIRNEGIVASCSSEYPSLPFALFAAGTTNQVVGFTLDRIFTFTPSQTFALYAYIFIPTITACTLSPDMVQFELLYFT